MEPLRVPPEAAGERLDQFLAAQLGSRAQAQRRIAAGAVTLDGALARKNDRLRGGETIVVAEEVIAAALERGLGLVEARLRGRVVAAITQVDPDAKVHRSPQARSFELPG